MALDEWGRKEVSQGERASLIMPIGVTGLRQFSGYIREEFLRELEGIRGRSVYDEMSKNDSTCGAILFAIKNLLRSMEWRIVSADPGNDRANTARDMLEDALFYDMEHTWPEFIESCCTMFVFGFAVHEILWKKRNGLNAQKPWLSSEFDDGMIMPRAFSPRSARTVERWVFDGEENLLGFEQSNVWGGTTGKEKPSQIIVPIRRCLHFKTTSELNNPEGQSLLRTAYRSWYWLKRMQEIEGIGTERDLAGYPVMKVPGAMLDVGAAPEMAAARGAYEEFLRRVRRDQNEGLLIPSDRDENGNPHYEFSLMSSGGTRQLRIDESIDRYQKDITRSVLADFIFLGADGGGSLALGKTKVQIFTEALKAYANTITSQINEIAVNQIWRLNGLDFDIIPTVEPGEIEAPDLQGLAQYITAMAGAGFDLATDTELENHLRNVADLPAAPDRTEDDDFFAMPSGRTVPKPAVEPQPEDDGSGGDPSGTAVEDEEDRDEALGKAMRAAWDRPEPLPFDWQAMMEGFEHGRRG